jgi:transcription elongation factor GreA
MSERFPITPEGHKRLEKELHHFKTVERPAVIKAIAEARAHGDLSENAEYSAAKEKQGFIEAKINDLSGKLGRAHIIDIATIESEHIQFGATVKMVDEESDIEITYKIVSDFEADIAKGHISLASPVAKALMGKKSGSSVEVVTPKGHKYYEILSIEYK